MKKYMFALLVLLFLAPMLPSANAQVVVAVGDNHHHRHHHHHHHHHHHRR